MRLTKSQLEYVRNRIDKLKKMIEGIRNMSPESKYGDGGIKITQNLLLYTQECNFLNFMLNVHNAAQDDVNIDFPIAYDNET